jgi:uncharacterized protein YggU (UPF0235/DUF167 family)
MAATPWTPNDGGITLVVRLIPKGGRDAIDGVETLTDGRSALKARVRAVPSGGEANDGLVRLIAKAVGVPQRDVTLVAGATARLKRLKIAGDVPTLIAALEKVVTSR